jgi:hypothetical protein
MPPTQRVWRWSLQAFAYSDINRDLFAAECVGVARLYKHTAVASRLLGRQKSLRLNDRDNEKPRMSDIRGFSIKNIDYLKLGL